MPDDSSSGTPDADGGDESPTERSRRLRDHLAATAELPLERTASRWLGEAEAVARDVAASDADAETVRARVATVRDLLSEVDATGHEAGDEHLEAAERLCAAILEDDGTERDEEMR